MGANSLDPQQSLALAREVRGGSETAWHAFVDGYAGLIHAVTARYLALGDTDDRRTVFVDVLERLRGGALDSFDGSTRLSTWLFIFTRSRCLDWLRSKHGRRTMPAWLREFPERDRRVFRLYYVEGIGCREIRRILGKRGRPLGVDQLADVLERIEERLDGRLRKRLAHDLFAQSVGMTSGRLMDFLHRIKIEHELKEEENRTDRDLVTQELSRALRMIREYVHRLPELERRVISLRYYEGRTARQTAAALELPNPRQVYTVEGRAIRRLRDMFETSEDPDTGATERT